MKLKLLEAKIERITRAKLTPLQGRIVQVTGLVLESEGPWAQMGEICQLVTEEGRLLVEVVGFRDNRLLLLPLGELDGISPGTPVISLEQSLEVPVGEGLLGRILDGLGRPMDGLGALKAQAYAPLVGRPPDPLTRQRISQPLSLGVRALDACLTVGKGQRMGIFAGSGVGKSTLLGMMARYTEADVNVICLVGERGREVREFLERDLGAEGLKRSVVIVATSDQPSLVRIKAPSVATRIAEYFRDLGKDVLLMMDSVTRFALAQREVGLAVGEPPTTRGYTPSVFAVLPRLLERAGAGSKGSITALYTVLVEGDDMNEPVADAVRGILDGHVVLSRSLAARGQYPAIDCLESVSRVMPEITDEAHQKRVRRLRQVLATYKDAEDLINIGAYVPGSNPEIDFAIEHITAVRSFLGQETGESIPLSASHAQLAALFGGEPR